MADTKPPRWIGDERGTLLALLQYQRESLVRKVDGVDDGAARRSPVPSGTSLLWLTVHMARAESTWVHQRFAGVEPEVGDDTVGPEDTVASAVADYRRTWERTDALVAAAPTLDVLCRDTGGDPPVDLRWVLLHLLEETARHAGHADILRELADGSTGR
jgi:hypothetical protein